MKGEERDDGMEIASWQDAIQTGRPWMEEVAIEKGTVIAR